MNTAGSVSTESLDSMVDKHTKMLSEIMFEELTIMECMLSLIYIGLFTDGHS
jgi:hypothetical protein